MIFESILIWWKETAVEKEQQNGFRFESKSFFMKSESILILAIHSWYFHFSWYLNQSWFHEKKQQLRKNSKLNSAYLVLSFHEIWVLLQRNYRRKNQKQIWISITGGVGGVPPPLTCCFSSSFLALLQHDYNTLRIRSQNHKQIWISIYKALWTGGVGGVPPPLTCCFSSNFLALLQRNYNTLRISRQNHKQSVKNCKKNLTPKNLIFSKKFCTKKKKIPTSSA